jgi:hypothetical protein
VEPSRARKLKGLHGRRIVSAIELPDSLVTRAGGQSLMVFLFADPCPPIIRVEEVPDEPQLVL